MTDRSWQAVGPDHPDGYRKAGVVETRDADGTERLGCYDHLLMHWTWVDAKGDIEYPTTFPDWEPTHWREADLPGYWPYESQEYYEQVASIRRAVMESDYD